MSDGPGDAVADGPDWSLDELVAAHVRGLLPGPLALAVGTHLALSRPSRRLAEALAALGGESLDREPPAALSPGTWERLSARLDHGIGVDARRPAAVSHRFPRPLRDHLPGGRTEGLHWRHLGSAAEAELDMRTPAYRTTLVRVRAGRAVPRHTHKGHELTLVLEGAFRDQLGHYRRGDLAIADSSVDHRPVADPGQDCLCLFVTDAPLHLTGRFGRLLNPFLRR